jgi:uncharacterized repeat protein (TIGR01451 family)
MQKYYWEIYGLSGDPSLIAAKYELGYFNLKDPDPMIFGQTNLTLNLVPDAMVSLYADSLLAVAKADANGKAILSFTPLQVFGSKKIEMVVTHPDFYPQLDSVDVLIPNQPYLVIQDIVISDSSGNNNQLADLGETVNFSVLVKNISNYVAKDILINVLLNDDVISGPTHNLSIVYDSIGQMGAVRLQLGPVILKNGLPDQSLLHVNVSVNYCDTLKTIKEQSFYINAPKIELTRISVDQIGFGNLNGILDASEKATIQLTFANNGHMQVSQTVVNFSLENNDYLTLSGFTGNLESLGINEKVDYDLLVKVADTFYPGQQVKINYSIAAENQQYDDSFIINLGQMPSFNMANNSNNEVITTYFYDSGGSNANYKDNENLVATFFPHNPDEGLMVEFVDFDVEASNTGCWDKLEIYDGVDVTNGKLTGMCNYNYNSAWLSQNTTGALTFKFTSDADKNKTGWKAFISFFTLKEVTFLVNSNGKAIDSARVKFYINQTVFN